MNIQTLTVGFLRLITLVLLYFIFIHISHLIYSIGFSDWSSLFMSATALTFLSVAATVFWFYPVKLTQLLFKNTDTNISTKLNTFQLVHTGVILLGFTVFTLAFIELAKWLIYYNIINTPPETHKTNLLNVGLFNIIARLLVSVLLLTKSYWLTEFLCKLNAPESSTYKDKSE